MTPEQLARIKQLALLKAQADQQQVSPEDREAAMLAQRINQVKSEANAAPALDAQDRLAELQGQDVQQRMAEQEALEKARQFNVLKNLRK